MTKNKKGALIAVPFVFLIVLGIGIVVVTILNWYFNFKITKSETEIWGNHYYLDNVALTFLMDSSCSSYLKLNYKNNGELLKYKDLDNLRRCWIYFFDSRVNHKVDGNIEKLAVMAATLSLGNKVIAYNIGDYINNEGEVKHKRYWMKVSRDKIITRNYFLDYEGNNVVMRVRYLVKG